MAKPSQTQDPLRAFKQDRQSARQAQDSQAELCALATVTADGAPAVRTLVLRDWSDGFALFLSASSPKWRQLLAEPRFELSCWFPSLQRQWRLRGHAEPLPRAALADNWQRRPEVSKRLDQAHDSTHPQSSELADRQQLLDRLDTLSHLPATEAPATVRGLALTLTAMECLQLAAAPGLHERLLWQRESALQDAPWTCTERVP